MGGTTTNFNQTLQKKESLKQQAEQTMRSQDKRMNMTAPPNLNPLSAIKNDSSGANILLKELCLEFEVRRSNLTDFYAQDDLPSCLVDVRLDSNNILALQNSGEIDTETTFQFEVVSKDKRCIKTRTKPKDVEYYLQKTIP